MSGEAEAPEVAGRVRRGGSDPRRFPPGETGGKAHGLARLGAAGARVPPWLVLDAEAWDSWVARDRPPPANAAEAEARQAEVRILPLPRPFCAEILRALDEEGIRDAPLAVRSSAVGEDGTDASFAGQFASLLGVRAGEDGEPLWNAVREVWASAWSAHAREYAAGRGEAPRMAVVVQALVEPEVAGVAFSADPVSGDRTVAVVCAAYGLGEGVVSGEGDADTFRVRADGGVGAEVAHKPEAVRSAPEGGTRSEPVSLPLRDAASLSDDEARRVAAAARRLAAALGAPQDVEWALAPGPDGPRTLWILQTRPITTLAPAGERRVWDNSNIVESYGGVVSALTFSFARGVYEQVYRQFCALVGVPEPVIHRNRHVFAHMLGRIHGRVFYNLLNWYRVLALLPGFALNRGFMERMMGVGERLQDPPETEAGADPWSDAVRLLRTVSGLAGAHRRLDRDVPAFHAGVDAILAPLADEELEAWDADRLATLYRRLEDGLLRRWQTPIVNDFFAMVWFGTLGRLTERWLPDAPPTLTNDLLIGEGEIVSVEPARRMGALARQVHADAAMAAAFAAEPDDAALWRRMETEPELAPLHREMRAYLAQWGDRCAEELKLETVTPAQDPALGVRTLRDYLARPSRDADAGEGGRALRTAAEQRVRRALRGPRRAAFIAVLRRTRRRVRDRENLRWERTRVFGVVRRIFGALGHRFAESGALERPRDIFHLTVEEVFAHLSGTGAAADLRALAALRRAELERWRGEPPPPDRFETVGPPDSARWSSPPAAPAPVDDDGTLRGTGCCPGVVRAPVRVVRDPADAGELAGHILVAERTDPGWTLLFPAAEGLLVQRGSLLSHSAIVAREVGLPCVVSIPGLLDALRDGEMVEMDGTAGTVRRLDPPGGEGGEG